MKEEAAGGHWLMVAPGFEDSARALGLDRPEVQHEYILGTSAAAMPASHGRAATTLVELPARVERLHLRRVLHGGALSGLWRGRLAGIGRVRAELLATAWLRDRGAAVPRPALAMAIRKGGLWRASLATVHEERSLDGLAFLATGPDRKQMLLAARALGHAIRRFHDVGGRHDDLHVGNLLLCEGDAGQDPRAVVIDLDRARVGEPPDPARRMRELMRLERSLRKRGLLEQVGQDAIASFFRAYHAGDTALRDALLVHYRA
jgi:hypothetical protein